MTHDPIYPSYAFRDEAEYRRYLEHALDLVRRNSQSQGERRRVIAELGQRPRDELYRLVVVMTDVAAFAAVERQRDQGLLELLDPTRLPHLPN
jgi:hypothetical protein